MLTVSESLSSALQHQKAGRLQVAEAICHQILAAEPDHAETHHLLGLVAFQTGNSRMAVEHVRRAIELKGGSAVFRFNLGKILKGQGDLEGAAACLCRALELKPDFAEAHNNLGSILREQEKLEAAAASYRRAVELKPDYAQGYNNLGVVLKELGRFDDAIAVCRQAVELKPDYAEAYNNLSNAYCALGKLDEAIAASRAALKLKPDDPATHNNLGNAFYSQGNWDDAGACYRRALELNVDYAEAHNNLGNAHAALGRFETAIVSYCRALELKPDFAEGYNNLGNAYSALRRLDDAVACYRRALELKPALAEAHTHLGVALKEQGRLSEAAAACRRAVELRPDYAEGYNNLGNVLKDQGRPSEATACYRQALDLKPDYVATHSNLLFALQYCSDVTPVKLAGAHAEFDRRHASHAPRLSRTPSVESAQSSTRIAASRLPLRLGFVSPDLGRHPVGYFLVGVLENLDPTEFETVCYCDRVVKDDLTNRLQAAANRWHDTFGLSDERLAEQIHAEPIDILFDLAGHTAHNRLLAFARHPVPIQMTWAGYVGTTGLAAMDYLLADRYQVPPRADSYYRERVLRMPDGYVCYDAPAYAPAVGPLPALDRGEVTFGCFNNPAKITSSVVEVWAEILRRLPRARMLLKFKGWDDFDVAQHFRDLFVAGGIDPTRLEFLGGSPHAELLATYNRIDLALDTFPYNGGLTTCEALWMGVPVVTFPGETFAGRHSLSHLSTAGLTETIAKDLEEYVKLAVSLATNLPRLAALRVGLRQQMARSPLCDAKRFAQNLSALLRGLWSGQTGC
jgi:predicted O-linked N-acetylglucosamine transferase (SPINDLY family)